MSEDYVKYWSLTHHPFLLAPDGNMMCVTGQYFECFERLKYAVSTNKGGVLIASENPGLGKTTILLKLIEEMKEKYGDNFRYAFIDHPTITTSQMIEQITGAITGQKPSDDKLKNLTMLKETLTEIKKRGGKNIIVIDEGQMLCDAKDILQELRILINLTHNNEYLHTFIFSGQKVLWDTLQEIPEFWQRLPVRYYFSPLKFEESRELIRYRLNKAGLDVARDIFTDEALDMIHKYSQGLPRTIIAVSDLAMLNGYLDKTLRVGSKEVLKAINAMTGKVDSPPSYSGEQKETIFPRTLKGMKLPDSQPLPQKSQKGLTGEVASKSVQSSSRPYFKTALYIAVIFFCILIGAVANRLVSTEKPAPNMVTAASRQAEQIQTAQAKAPVSAQSETKEESSANDPNDSNDSNSTEADIKKETLSEETKINKDILAAFRDEKKKRPKRSAIVSKDIVNVRSAPFLDAPRIITIVQGEKLNVVDERKDGEGDVWYKVELYNDRVGWISEKVVVISSTQER